MDNKIENFLSSHPYSVATKRTYTNILTRFLGNSADPHSISAGELIRYLEKSGWENARQRLALACIRKYLGWLYGISHPALSAKIKRTQGKPMRSLKKEQVSELLASFDRHSPKGARDLAMAATLLQTGLRAAEICRLEQAYTDTEHGYLQVLVKGGSWEYGFFNGDTAAHIEHWKRFRETLNPKGGYLFVSLKSTCLGKGLTSEGLNQIVRQWGLAIGIELSPHDFRRTYATVTSENGGSDRAIMEGGRWKSQEMFNRYTRNIRMEALRQFLPDTKLKETV